ncbi:MAG: hypothetical protein ACD_75C02312G0001 [uncultured bacterium]|nr:MAG: hypothetical protein ACD_75C02312G0001 [uncultured bacterium]
MCIGKEIGAHAGGGGIFRHLPGNFVLIETAFFVELVKIEGRPGLQDVQALIEIGESRRILELAVFSGDPDAKLVQGHFLGTVVLVAFQTAGRADEGCTLRNIAGEKDLDLFILQFGGRNRLIGLISSRKISVILGDDIDKIFAVRHIGDLEVALTVGQSFLILVHIGSQVIFQRLVIRTILLDFHLAFRHLRHIGGWNEVDGCTRHILGGNIFDRPADRGARFRVRRTHQERHSHYR